jgi:hypothetical protein
MVRLSGGPPLTRDEWTTAARRILATPKATDAWRADQLWQLHVDHRVLVTNPPVAELDGVRQTIDWLRERAERCEAKLAEQEKSGE